MKNQIINEITQQMLPVLNNFELEKLRTALNLCLLLMMVCFWQEKI